MEPITLAIIAGIGVAALGLKPRKTDELPPAIVVGGAGSDFTALDRVTTSRTKVTVSGSQDARVLIAEARQRGNVLTVEEMTAARLIASEHGSGSPQEQAVFVDAELNRCARKGISLTAHLTAKTGIYGRQGNHDGVRRPAATRLNPTERHLAIAKHVLSGQVRGISKGAERFFDPRAQLNTHRAYKAGTGSIIASCHPRGTLKAWSYDLPSCSHGKRNRCCDGTGMPELGAQPGSRPERWVGPIAGVDALRVMAMAPSSYGSEHDKIYLQADALIASLE